MCSDRLENKRPALLHGGERGGTKRMGVCITELQEPAFFQQSFDFDIGNVATFGFVINIEEIDFSLIHCCYDRNRNNPCASALASAF